MRFSAGFASLNFEAIARMCHWGDWLIYLSQLNALNLAEFSRIFARSNIKSAANFSSFNLTSFFALMLAACSGGGGGGGAPTPP